MCVYIIYKYCMHIYVFVFYMCKMKKNKTAYNWMLHVIKANIFTSGLVKEKFYEQKVKGTIFLSGKSLCKSS